MLAIPKAETPPARIDLSDPPLPIDDSDGGCDTPNNTLKVNTAVWTRRSRRYESRRAIMISDNGREVYSALKLRGIDTLLVMGVHTNMCVLKRIVRDPADDEMGHPVHSYS